MTKEERKEYMKKYSKEYYKKNKAKKSLQGKKYYNNNKTKRNLQSMNYRGSHIEKVLYWSSVHNARKKGIEHNIKEEDIVIPSHCPYLGIELTRERGQGRLQNGPSVDRIDNSKGYVKGNIQIISWQANVMKRDSTEIQLIAFAEGVLRIHGRVIDTETSASP